MRAGDVHVVVSKTYGSQSSGHRFSGLRRAAGGLGGIDLDQLLVDLSCQTIVSGQLLSSQSEGNDKKE